MGFSRVKLIGRVGRFLTEESGNYYILRYVFLLKRRIHIISYVFVIKEEFQ